LGIELDKTKNAENAGVISKEKSKDTVRVIRTDEELMIARILWRFVQGKS
jgi:acetate kinase